VQLLRFIKFLPTLLGFALSVMMQVGPDEAEINLCKWPKKVWPSLSADCLHGTPAWFLYLVSISLIFLGFIWFFWPRIIGTVRTLEFTWPVRRKKSAMGKLRLPVIALSLSPGEHQFRTELRRFIRSNFDEIRDGVYTVNQFITSKYDEARGSQTNPLSRMFLQLFACAIRPHIDEVDRAYDLQDDEFDTSAVQDLIKKAMQSYVQWQEIVLQFQQVSGISLADRSLGILLGADERAFGKLRDLKAFPHATKLNDLDVRSVFASRNGVF
jgi:hypothetical protein